MTKVRNLTFLFTVLLASNPLSAQGLSGQQIFIGSLLIIGVIVFLWVILMTAENLMQVEAGKVGADTSKGRFALIPRLRALWGKSVPAYAGKVPFIRLNKGFDIRLAGKAKKIINPDLKANTFAVKPKDFHGISPIPKVVVEIGQEVKAGETLFFDKKRPEIKYVAPVSGEVIAINRGEKRSIAEVVILADKKITYHKQSVPDFEKCSEEELISFMKESGLWTLLNERPYDIIPGDQKPNNIFISSFSTAPLAPDYDLIMEGREPAFQKGLDVLSRLTDGKIYLGLNANNDNPPSDCFVNAQGVEKVYFLGKHPAGNVGIQIHQISPIKPKETVWTVGVQEVAQIGEMFISGNYDARRIISLNGVSVDKPCYVDTYQGASVKDLLASNLKEGHNRFISGDPLSGKKITAEGFLGFRDQQFTVIEEGDDFELFGWLLGFSPRPSASGSFPNFLFRNHDHEVTTNTHGEKRAFVMTGQYENVLPMDIYPQQLMKAILSGDIEKMEGLGINELTEEDLALCEFVCTSKMPLQSILRDGLEMMREQG